MTLEQTTAPAEATKASWATNLIYGGLAVVSIGFAVLKVVAIFGQGSLPGCTSSRALDTVRSILRDHNVASPTFASIVETGSDHTEILCRSVMTSGTSRFELSYRSYKAEDGKVMVSATWKPI